MSSVHHEVCVAPYFVYNVHRAMSSELWQCVASSVQWVVGIFLYENIYNALIH